MTFIRRLMEIKEEQRLWEKRMSFYAINIDGTLTEILKVLKQNGKKK